jgi:metal-dependent HD superfamily phosphatase/phosphodiesterase
MPINVPARHNDKLKSLVERINSDAELHQWWKCANINAVDRAGITDHGEVHIRIVANVALKMLRMLYEAGVEPSVVKNYGMSPDDAEVIVVLAECLHDVGIAIHREDHERHSLIIAVPKLKELLDGIYDVDKRVIITSEVLHCIYSHRWDVPCLTIEAGVVKVADTLDMTEGRSRIPFEAGKVNIHSVSAAAIDRITLHKGDTKPIGIEIAMSNSAGIFQIDELLKRKLRNSSIADYVEIEARIEGEVEKKLLKIYTF